MSRPGPAAARTAAKPTERGSIAPEQVAEQVVDEQDRQEQHQ